MQAKYIISSKARAHDTYAHKIVDFDSFVTGLNKLNGRTGFQVVVTNNDAMAPAGTKEKHKSLDQITTELKKTVTLIKHFCDDSLIEFVSGKEHTLVPNIDDSNIPKKYIQIQLMDKDGNVSYYPLSLLDRQQIKKNMDRLSILGKSHKMPAMQRMFEDIVAQGTELFELDKVKEAPPRKPEATMAAKPRSR